MKNNSRIQSSEAILSSAGGYSSFIFRGYHIRFKAPYSLERYEEVINWDNGYLVVMAKYRHNLKAEEEYIDLRPILKGLYIDAASFLKPIKSVRIAMPDIKSIADKADIIVNGYAFTREEDSFL